jgi:hypothetical protein
VGYLHIENLYKATAQTILLFRECYALEKIHGTSAHINWDGHQVGFHPGGVKMEQFVALFDKAKLTELFTNHFGANHVTVYGEAYGGRCQGMSSTYGKDLKFVVFDVKVRDHWLSVPNAHGVATALGLEFVYYNRVSTDLAALDAERMRPSEQAKRNGVVGDKVTEGIVVRPIVEMTGNNGDRIIAKHKNADFEERNNPPQVVDPSRLQVLADAQKIAEEWVNEMRLTHVLDKLGNPNDLKETGKVIAAMVEDVLREAAGEIVDSKDARKAIGAKAAQLYKARVTTVGASG